MLVDLRKLKPNPARFFDLDPIDEEQVAKLADSIHKLGFWGGVVCRRSGKDIEIAAGQHRVTAAIRAGVCEADVTVLEDIDEATLINIYARENATQRANIGIAQTGSVASALRYLVQAAARTESVREFSHSNGEAYSLGDCGEVGRKEIGAFLGDALTGGAIDDALANLKSSGAYKRIVEEVEAKVRQQHAEEFRELDVIGDELDQAKKEEEEAKKEEKEAKKEEDKEKAKGKLKRARARKSQAKQAINAKGATGKVWTTTRRAKKGAQKHDRVFDFEGVSKHLKNAHQVEVFRKVVTSEVGRQLLPLDQQAKLAQAIVEQWDEQYKDREKPPPLSGEFIKDRASGMLLSASFQQQRLSKEEKARLRLESATRRVYDFQHDFVRCVRTMKKLSEKICQEVAKWPKDQPWPMYRDFLHHLKNAKNAVDNLVERLQHDDSNGRPYGRAKRLPALGHGPGESREEAPADGRGLS